MFDVQIRKAVGKFLMQSPDEFELVASQLRPTAVGSASINAHPPVDPSGGPGGGSLSGEEPKADTIIKLADGKKTQAIILSEYTDSRQTWPTSRIRTPIPL